VQVGDLVPLPGGRSGLTLHAVIHGVDAVSSVVVKAAPPGRPAVGRHDVLRQARVMTSLQGVAGVVVPEVLATGTDPVPFCVMSRLPGEAVEPVLDAGKVQLRPELVRGRAVAAAGMLAALHRVRAAAFIDAAAGPGADLATEVRRWRVTADAADAADSRILHGGTRLADLLERHLPGHSLTPVLIHGDYRLGNIVFDGAQPTGIIDWEIWGVADPGVDLGWFLVFCDADLFPGIGAPVKGMPTARELLQCYAEHGGQVPEDTAWYEAFGRFKMAAIMAHNLRRHREGRHVDPFQESLPPTIERLVATGLEKLTA